MSSKAISVSYALKPPPGTAQPTCPPSLSPDTPATPIPVASTLLFPIPTLAASPTKSQLSATTQYYTTTSAALLAAQTALNSVLTGWKEAVGDGEKEREEVGGVGFGRGKAMVMSERVNGEMKEGEGAASESEDESEEDV